MVIHSNSEPLPFKAMILAAGRGERMRPLTDMLPKPLLRVGDRSLIEYHLENLAQAGFVDIVINHAHLGEMIEEALGGGERYGVCIQYSHESVALETAGGIVKALPLLTDKADAQPFLVVNADIYCRIDFAKLLPILQQMQLNPWRYLAYLILVDNPSHHPDGDFSLVADKITLLEDEKLTFSGIGIYHPKFFAGISANVPTKLVSRLHPAIKAGAVSGEYFNGEWIDVGTPERLELLNKGISKNSGL